MNKGGSKRCWVWSVAREDAVSYCLLSSRSTQAARTVLDDYAGVAICDGYNAYDVLARERKGSDPTLAHCWAHVRRKFVEAEPLYPQGRCEDRPDCTALRDRGRGEASASREADGHARCFPSEAVEAGPRRDPQLANDAARTAAIGTGQCDCVYGQPVAGPRPFLVDPKIPLDTNSVEQAVRGVAVGRKNHYGSRSERGTRTAALFYSPIESAKLCRVEPRAYLREATLRAVRDLGAVTLAREVKSPES